MIRIYRRMRLLAGCSRTYGRWAVEVNGEKSEHMIRRWEVLNRLIERFEYHSYLEIGVAGGANFRRVTAVEKLGVDPALRWWSLLRRDVRKTKSDRFFSRNKRTFDLVFIDGLHIAQQAFTDIQNALIVLNPGGTVVVHDCLPSSREQQIVPRIQSSWTGDVWRAFLSTSMRSDLLTMILDCDRGCGIIRPGRRAPNHPSPPADLDPLRGRPSWEEFDAHKTEWLQIVPDSNVMATLDSLADKDRGR
jgi:hypothetical protein